MNYYWNRNDEIEEPEEPTTYTELSAEACVDGWFAAIEATTTPERETEIATAIEAQRIVEQHCIELNWSGKAIEAKYGLGSAERRAWFEYKDAQHPMTPAEIDRMMAWCD